MFSKRTVKDINLKGKTVLVRVDYNVPGDEKGHVKDDYRIKNSLPTIQYLLSQNCKVILVSHRDRPGGQVVPRFSLAPVAKELQKLLKRDVQFCGDCIGPFADKAKAALKPGDVLLLENTRFHPGEDANDPAFAKALAKDVDIFVQDAFGNAHRKHASMDAITKILPSVAGLLLEKEVTSISDVIENPKRPLMAIVGGAKISDKIAILEKFIEIADIVAIGGAMANTFLLAKGIHIGKSMAEKADVPLARDILQKAAKEAKKRHFVFYVPQDGVVANKVDKLAHTRIVDWSAHVFASVENYPKLPPRHDGEVGNDELILDIGPYSGAFIAGSVQMVGTVVWNGVVGVTETPSIHGPTGPFSHGTETILEALMGEFGHKPFTLIGGGDTAAYVAQRKLTDCFDHVSTGGGASLELMAGKKLPAVEALQDKKGSK